jgi:uncharacterized protein YjbJ (UPF0337 family)
MTRERFKEKWNDFKGELKKQWGRFSDDDLMQIEGDYDKFINLVQERYGEHKEAVHRWVEHWYGHYPTTKPGTTPKAG